MTETQAMIEYWKERAREDADKLKAKGSTI